MRLNILNGEFRPGTGHEDVSGQVRTKGSELVRMFPREALLAQEARVNTRREFPRGGAYLNSEKQRTEKQRMRAQGSAVAMLRAKTVKSV